MIKPTVGRNLYYRSSSYKEGDNSQPFLAFIVYVHSDTMINIAGFDMTGHHFALTSVRLKQEGDTIPPNTAFCEWMPFQVGQAKAQEASKPSGGAG